MIRQAVNYLRGATSSAVLVGAAVIAALAIVFAVGTGSNPISALGLAPDPDPVVVMAEEAEPAEDETAETDAIVAPEADVAATAPRRGAQRPRAEARRPAPGADRAPARPQPPARTPVDLPRQPATGGGGGAGDGVSRPVPPPAAGTRGGAGGSGSPGRPPGGGAGDNSVGNDGGGSGDAGGNNNPGGGSGGASSAAPPAAGGAGRDPSLAAGLNDTVDALDETLGGTLGKTGLVDPVKETTEALLGRDSTVGKTLDGVTKGLDGVTKGLGRLLGGRK